MTKLDKAEIINFRCLVECYVNALIKYLALIMILSLFSVTKVSIASDKSKQFEEYREFAKELEAKSIPDEKLKQEVLGLHEKVAAQSSKYQSQNFIGQDQCYNSHDSNTDKESIVGTKKIDTTWFDKNIYIFVSTSMSENNLIDLAKEAKKYNAALIMRGLLDNSYIRTVQFFQKLIDKTGEGISIDPELFKKFNIMAVPTFVVEKSDQCTSVDLGCRPFYDKVSGNISLEDALLKIKQKGDLFAHKSRIGKSNG